MSEEEVAQLNVIGRGEGVCLKSEELHIVISMGWKQEGGFFTKLLVGKDLVAPMESCYRKRMKPFGYMKNEDLQRQVAGETARGLRYNYQVNGTGMTGESFVLTRDNTRYYLHVYYRTQLGNESREVWKSILDSAGWQ
jgi:hypothetical protein